MYFALTARLTLDQPCMFQVATICDRIPEQRWVLSGYSMNTCWVQGEMLSFGDET